MNDCWLSPYGEVVDVPTWGHANVAAKIILERYYAENGERFEDTQDVWCSCNGESPTDMLESMGWIRYSSTYVHGWCVFKGYSKEPTREQKEKMFDLTGFIYEDL